jgi:hypothetical protein
MKLFLLSFFFTVTFFLAFSQTKLVAHRSHGGTANNFLEQYQQQNLDNSNLGAAPRHYIASAVLDSLIYVNDTVVIMVTSRCTLLQVEENQINGNWQPGRDTLTHHYLFTKCHQLDKIKRCLKYDYNFKNQKDIKFIGYDNEAMPKILPKVAIPPLPCAPNLKASLPKSDIPLLALASFTFLLTAGLFYKKFG